ncbi:MAG: hypothetical protein ACD_39C00286G0001, partial [uncultured bacterium]
RKEVCPCCNGAGKIVSAANIANSIRKQLCEEAKRYQTEKIIINAHRMVIDLLRGRDSRDLKDLERTTGRKLILKPQNGLDIEAWKIEPVLERTSKKPEKSQRQDRNFQRNPRTEPGAVDESADEAVEQSETDDTMDTEDDNNFDSEPAEENDTV